MKAAFRLLPIVLIVMMLVPVSIQGLHFARWWTTLGSFTATLRDEIVPITANNFMSLTNSGFYDGLHFHRVVEGFVIQDGDPLGTGYGGPGYNIQDEFSPLLHHDSAGVLAMARTSAPNSAGSQYYITLAPTPWLDGNYAIFGKVFEGLDVVMAIGSVPVDSNDHPITNVYIDSLRILDLAIYNVFPPNDTLVYYDLEMPVPFVVEAFNDEMNVQISWYIDDVLYPGETEITFQPVCDYGLHTFKCITATDEISWTTEWQVYVFRSGATDDEAIPPVPELEIKAVYPNPFAGSIRLEYSLKKSQPVQISVYDIRGRIVSCETTAGKAGINHWQWDATDRQSSATAEEVFLIQVKTPSSRIVRKAVYLK
jgi:peptidyl-prolyl cis-trans isomerase A (cyclophilin A)